MASLHNMLMAGTVVGDDRIEVKSSFFGLCKTAVYQPTGSKLTAVILEVSPRPGRRTEPHHADPR